MTSRHPDDTAPALVIGLGQTDRGDDAVGPAVAERVRGMCLPGVRVMELQDPAALLEAWQGVDLVVVADALRSGHRAGTVSIVHVGHGPIPAGTGAAGTHAFGVAETVELARALGRLPAILVIVGVEAERFRLGEPLSAPVRAAVGRAAQVVTGVIRAGRAR